MMNPYQPLRRMRFPRRMKPLRQKKRLRQMRLLRQMKRLSPSLEKRSSLRLLPRMKSLLPVMNPFQTANRLLKTLRSQPGRRSRSKGRQKQWRRSHPPTSQQLRNRRLLRTQVTAMGWSLRQSRRRKRLPSLPRISRKSFCCMVEDRRQWSNVRFGSGGWSA